MPNSVSMSNEIFQKGGGSCIKFYEPDLLKMATMSLDECKKYREFLILRGNFMRLQRRMLLKTFRNGFVKLQASIKKVSKIQPIISSKIETGNVQVVAQDLSEKIATTAKKTLTSRKNYLQNMNRHSYLYPF